MASAGGRISLNSSTGVTKALQWAFEEQRKLVEETGNDELRQRAIASCATITEKAAKVVNDREKLRAANRSAKALEEANRLRSQAGALMTDEHASRIPDAEDRRTHH